MVKTLDFDMGKVYDRISEIRADRTSLEVSQSFVDLAERALDDYLIYLVGGCEKPSLARAGITNYFGSPITDILAVTDNQVRGMRVLDLGCGSVDQGEYFSDQYLPFNAEILTRLGAQVVGVDIRPNPNASYDHRVGNLLVPEFCLETVLDDGDYDYILASRLAVCGLVTPSRWGLDSVDEEKEGYKVLEIVRGLIKDRQLIFTNLGEKNIEVPALKELGFDPVMDGDFDSGALGYRQF